ncbi:hypothetical protein ABT104_23465 [Streptomyces mobaraensis]|uniref:hypothetical protein n=1 Tax=Streptomyces mobaraensis TaxID=35621 RepID=UPI003321CDD4
MHPVADALNRAAANATYGRPLTTLVAALEQTVVHACAGLGYRLFPRAVNAYFVGRQKEMTDRAPSSTAPRKCEFGTFIGRLLLLNRLSHLSGGG